MRRLLTTLATIAVMAVPTAIVSAPSNAAAPRPPGSTLVLHVVSSPGDPIGHGRTWSYADGYSDGVVQFGGTEGGLSFRLTANNTDYQVQLSAPAGRTLTTGTFEDARRAQFNGTHPGLWVAGEGRGCNHLTGSFAIRSIATDVFGSIAELDASFTQYCDGAKSPLRGTLQYKVPSTHAVVLTSSHPVTVQGVPTTLTAQAASGSLVSFYDGTRPIGKVRADSHRLARFTTSTLAPGRHYLSAHSGRQVSPRVLQRVYSNRNSFWFTSAVGDGFAGGAGQTFSPHWSTQSFTATTTRVTVSVRNAAGDWQVVITAPVGKALHAGTYPYTQHGQDAPPTAAGLFVSGNGHSCTVEHGSMRIASLRSTARGKITSVALTFTDHCDHDTQPLTGSVRFTAG